VIAGVFFVCIKIYICISCFKDSTVYQLLGNHDVKGIYSKGFRGAKGDKALNKLMGYLSMSNTYYFEKRGKVVFIVLNTNDLAQYSIDAANKKRKTGRIF